MTEDTDKKISELSDQEILDLTRMTEADKWANGWRALPTILSMLLLFLGPACIHLGYRLGADQWLSWPDGAGMRKYTAMIAYMGIAIATSFHLRKLSRSMDERLDEVERHIEYKATAAAGNEAIWYGMFMWGFALWFPQYYQGIMAALPLLIFFSFYFAYFGIRMKLRHELEA